MPIPTLIHGVPVKIEQVDATATVFDPDLEEPIGNVRRATSITLRGQVQWTRSRQLQTTRGGNVERASGYVLFRFVDLENASVVLAKNDVLTSLGNEVGRWWINDLEPIGHYPTLGATMVKAHFSNRAPAKSPT